MERESFYFGNLRFERQRIGASKPRFYYTAPDGLEYCMGVRCDKKTVFVSMRNASGNWNVIKDRFKHLRTAAQYIAKLERGRV